MVIQSLLLRNSPPLLGEGRGGDPGPDPGDPGPDPGDPGPGPGDPGPDPGDPGSERRRTSMLRCLLLPLDSRQPNPGFPVRVAAHLQHGIHLPSNEGTRGFLFWEREVVVAMIIQSLRLRSFPFLLGKGRGGDHGHTEHSSDKDFFFSWEREEVVIMVIQSLFLNNYFSSGKGKG